jgi:hypothetical protein
MRLETPPADVMLNSAPNFRKVCKPGPFPFFWHRSGTVPSLPARIATRNQKSDETSK